MTPKLLKMLELNETFSILSQPFPLILYLLLAASFFILLRRWSSKTDSSVPPSPPKLPVIGNLHQVSKLAHRSFQSLSQRYGPVMLLHFGSRPVLVISSAEAASQIFKTHDLIFSDRPKFKFFEKITYNYKDMVSAPYGEYWRQLRSVSVLNLLSSKMVRSYGAVRLEETRLMINNIRESCSAKSSSSSSSTSTVLNLSDIFNKLSNDIICRVAMGRRYSELRENGGKEFMNLAQDLTEFFTRVNIGDYIPWLSWITRLTGFDAEFDALGKRSDAFFDMVVQEHIDKINTGDGLNDNETLKDFVDVLLSVQKENTVGVPIDRVGIKGTIADMFGGGSDTTFTTLEWTMSELLRNPKVMKKLQNEVRAVVGNKEDIADEDLIGMHYLKAVIKETFRLHPPFPLLLPRSSRQDVKIYGYNIKANTQVMVNAWEIGRDPKSYANPELFEPERFLNSVIDYKGNDFELIPFGSGRRGCPGMSFGVAVIEIALANIVQKFDWMLPDGTKPEDLDMSESTGATAHRKYPLKVVAKPYLP